VDSLQCDITDKKSLESAVQAIQKDHPKGIQLLVNNAGIAVEDHTQNKQPDNMGDAKAVHDWLWSSQPDEWQRTFNANSTGQYYTSVAFLPLLAAGTDSLPGHSASIINITSVSGVLKTSSSGQFAYAASKAATLHLTRNLASTFKDLKVRVNSIAPGLFPSEMTERKPADEHGKSRLEQGTRGWPAGRAGDEGDIAGTVIWLASAAGLFVNGHTVYLDGGLTLVSPSAA
jgi:NAD(P)-dependent dehydrogenase (short-subunit alcohol dehydrogenase family)